MKTTFLKAVVVAMAVVTVFRADCLCGRTEALSKGNQYYLSPAGNDGADGKTSRTAWKTFHHAQFVLGPGDILLVRGGLYPDTCFFPQGGTDDRPIVISAYPGETPIITGRACWGLFFAIYHDWITIVGLTFQDTSGDNAIVYLRNARHVVLRNNTFKNNRGATDLLVTVSSDVTIDGNDFDVTGDPSGEGAGDNIYVAGSSHVLIQHNNLGHAGHAAIDVINDSGTVSAFNVIRDNTIDQYWGGGIYITRGSHNNLVERNRIRHAGEGCSYPKAGLQIAAAQNIIRYNIIDKTSTRPLPDNGIALHAYTFSGIHEDATDNRIYNNVVYGAGRCALYVWVADTCVVTCNKILNNIFYRNRTAGAQEQFWPAGNYYLGFELYHAATKWRSFPNGNYFLNNLIIHADGSGDHSGTRVIYYDADQSSMSLKQVQDRYPEFFSGNIELNPMFKDAENGDFELRPGSPAISGGADLTVTAGAKQNTTEVPVEDAEFFFDGYGFVPGDLIRIGVNRPARIECVDYKRNIITVARPVSFEAREAVNLAGSGSRRPDIGAIPWAEQ